MYPGFHIGLALIPPWAMQEYRPKGLISASAKRVFYFGRAHLRLATNPFALLFWGGVRGAGFKRTSFACSFVGLCRMRLSQGIETEGAGSLLL